MKTIHKLFLYITILVAVFSLSFGFATSLNQKVHSIITSPIQLNTLVLNQLPQHIFIDLRDKVDYENGHINGFININSFDPEFIDYYLTQNQLTNKIIVLMCYSGERSANVYNYLSSLGYRYLVYVSFGYEAFASEIEGFIPRTGECDCIAYNFRGDYEKCFFRQL